MGGEAGWSVGAKGCVSVESGGGAAIFVSIGTKGCVAGMGAVGKEGGGAG